MNSLTIHKPIVSVQWLFKNFNHPNLVVLDATIAKVGPSVELHSELSIKYARFFDIKKMFSQQNARFPNTIVTPEVFEKRVCQLGISSNDTVVVYDQHGVYSSPRAWWLFKAMGHKNVAVLDGGLPEWQKAKYPTEKIKEYRGEFGNFKAHYEPTSIYNYHQVLDAITNENKVIVDARSVDRFKGLQPEPREGLRSGHIPNSKNLPFTEIVDGTSMLSISELSKKFKAIANDDDKLIFTCGSGITACILALGAELSGHKNVSIYDGSWTEWGSLHELPIEV